MSTSFDALSLSAVRDELEPRLVGGRIQKLVLADEMSLALEVYRPAVGRTAVLLSADPDTGRAEVLHQLPARGVERDTPFSLLLRKHLRNARIHAVCQPRLERVLALDCESRDTAEQQHRIRLILEAMGRRGNLVLVGEDGTILDAARRSPPSRNPRRPVLPHLRYDDPPPQQRLLPEQVSAAGLAQGARGRAGPLARYLSDRLAGLSPLAGRELSFRATGAADTPLSTVADWGPVVAAIAAFFEPLETHVWRPTLAVRNEQAIDAAPYRLEHLAALGAELIVFESMSAALQAYYQRGPAWSRRGDALAAERKPLLASLERARRAAERRTVALEQQLARGQEQHSPLRRAGELLLTYQAEVPAQASTVELEGETLVVDPGLSAVENAQAYFGRYRKAREALERVPALLETARQDAEHLAELRALVEIGEDMDAIRALRREVAAATGEPGAAARRTTSKAPYRRINLDDGWEALVGSSASGNATVTFDLARPDDMWLHARGIPGAHVILRRTSHAPATPPDAIVERGAELAAWHSAARSAGHVEVDAAPRRSVRKVPGGPPGLVRYANERTLRVRAKP